VPRAEREEQMLEVATEMFSSRGFATVAMDDIAAACGVSKPLLYSYFGSKEGLFGACAKHAAAGLMERLQAISARTDLPPDESLWQGITALFDFVESHQQSWELLYPPEGRPPGPVGDAADHARSAMGDLLERLFSDTARSVGVGEDALVHSGPHARAFTAASIAMASDWLARPSEPRELAALRLMNLTWIGFGGMLAGRMWLPGQGEVT
jgi:AcrR family transcriptional regulator